MARGRQQQQDTADQAEQATPAEVAEASPTEGYAERSYADALTAEHAEVLRAAGQHPDEG